MVTDKTTKKATAFPARVRDVLAGAHPRIEERDRARQSRLLSWLLIISFVVGTLTVGFDLFVLGGADSHSEFDTFVSIGALVLLAGAYALNRLGHFIAAATFSLMVMAFAVFAAAVPSPGAADVGFLYYLVIPVVISSVMMPVSFTVVFGSIIVAGMVVFHFAVPSVHPFDVPVLSTMTIFGLVFFAAHQRRLQEADREADLLESEERFRTIVRHTPEAILLLERSGTVAQANEHALRLFGETRLVGASIEEVLDQRSNPTATELLTSHLAQVNGNGPIHFDMKWTSPNGFPVVCETQLIHLNGTQEDLVQAILTDVTERRAAEDKLRHMATHDSLTDLPNRTLFTERLSAAASRADRSGKLFAVLFLDLDNFKRVNDAFGHRLGDELLSEIASRLAGVLRGSDMVARFGGDEFAVLVEGLDSPISVVPVLEKIIAQVAHPITLQASQVAVTTSIGVSLYPENGEGADDLLQAADTALYSAKSAGKNIFAFYDSRMAESTLDRLSLTADLRTALANDELFVLYQPQVDIATGRIVAFEALVRWDHPERGVIKPDQFLPIAEEGGLIAAIGDWVLNTACRQLHDWNELGFRDLRVSVNLAASQVRDRQIIGTVRQVLSDNDLAPEQLELELTENILFRETEGAAALLRRIKDLGIRLAVDDFGSGYSTLRQIAAFPIDVMKIDKLFAAGVLTDQRDVAVVEGLARIAQSLGMTTVAEGIESYEQLQAYRSFGFDLVQGFIVSEPVSAQACQQLLTTPTWAPV